MKWGYGLTILFADCRRFFLTHQKEVIEVKPRLVVSLPGSWRFRVSSFCTDRSGILAVPRGCLGKTKALIR